MSSSSSASSSNSCTSRSRMLCTKLVVCTMASTRPPTSAALSSSAQATKASGSTMLLVSNRLNSTSITFTCLPFTSTLGNFFEWQYACTAYSASTCAGMEPASRPCSASPNSSFTHHLEAVTLSTCSRRCFKMAAPVGLTGTLFTWTSRELPFSPVAKASVAAARAIACSVFAFSRAAAASSAALAFASLAFFSASSLSSFLAAFAAFCSASAAALSSAGVGPAGADAT
mmetsp:Transcript_59241/g.104208  ORF Transcript_59241/g.104208 Transcript_59241/m.104208 type:complete len:229 (+) Transcript_59241:195-881(+)